LNFAFGCYKVTDATLVVHAVNDGHWLFEVSTLRVAKLTR